MADNIPTIATRWRDPNGTQGEVFVTAHRGLFLDNGRITAAENSVAAIDNARMAGVDMVEVDVHFTSDGTAVVIHDALLDRTAAATGAVADKTWAEVKDIALVNPATRDPLGSTIPALADVFAALHNKMMINVEVKTGIDAIPAIAKVAAQAGVSDQLTIKSNLKDATAYAQVAEIIANTPDPVDFIPVLIDSRDNFDTLAMACELLNPHCIECVVDYQKGHAGYNLLENRGMTADGGWLFSQPVRRLMAQRNMRQFINTLYVNPEIPGNHQWNGGRSCELARVVPDAVYSFWIAHGATVIQSDDAPFVLDWLRRAGFRGGDQA